MKKGTKIYAVVMSLVMLMMLFAGCGSQTNTSTPVSDPASPNQGQQNAAPDANNASARDTLIVASASEMMYYDCVQYGNLMATEATRLMDCMLFRSAKNGGVEPLLVDSYEMTDHQSWVFTLKEGVKFHDGTSLDSTDVKASLEFCKAAPAAATYAKAIDHIEIVDERTVEIFTTTTNSQFIFDLMSTSLPIRPSEKVNGGHDFNAEPCGCGPYMYKSSTTGEETIFERFDDYFEGTPPIKTIIWKVIPEDSARAIALQAHDVDYLYNVGTANIPTLEATSDVTVDYFDYSAIYWLALNNQEWPLNNKYVRKAISSAIDRDRVLAVGMEGNGSIVTGCVSPTFGDAIYSEKNALPYDVEKAKQFLAQSGEDLSNWTMTILVKDEMYSRIAQVIQGCLAEIGIDVKVETMESAVMMQRILAGDYCASLNSYYNGSAVIYLNRMYGSAGTGATNWNLNEEAMPVVDDYVNRIFAEKDAATQDQLTKELVEFINDESIYANLCASSTVKAYDSNLENVYISPLLGVYWHEVRWAN